MSCLLDISWRFLVDMSPTKRLVLLSSSVVQSKEISNDLVSPSVLHCDDSQAVRTDMIYQ